MTERCFRSKFDVNHFDISDSNWKIKRLLTVENDMWFKFDIPRFQYDSVFWLVLEFDLNPFWTFICSGFCLNCIGFVLDLFLLFDFSLIGSGFKFYILYNFDSVHQLNFKIFIVIFFSIITNRFRNLETKFIDHDCRINPDILLRIEIRIYSQS